MSAAESSFAARDKIDALTGIRAFAAILVLGYHFQFLGWYRSWVFAHGFMGVELFFVLSGYVLCHVHYAEFAARQGSYRRFIVLRLARIYPAYAVVFVLWLIALALADWLNLPRETATSHGLAAYSVAYALMVQAWGLFVTKDFNPPAWSISAEWFWYLLFPFMIVLADRLRSYRAVLLGIVLSLAGYLAMRQVLEALDVRELALPRAMGGFVFGILAWRLNSIPLPARATGVLTDAAFLCLCALLVSGLAGLWLETAMLALMIVLIFGLGREQGGTAWLLSRRPVVYLGEISYGFYLIHWLAILGIFKISAFPPFHWMRESLAMLIFTACATALVAAMALYHLVEQPARAAVRRRIRDWR